MKFLIAASFLCIALVGQIQGGSLRGLEVRKPHQEYGAPLLEAEIHIDETVSIPDTKDTTIIEYHKKPIISQPFPEYGAPAVIAEVDKIPFEDTLPHVDVHVDFAIPSNAYLPPAIPEPVLEPVLPPLPEAPVVPDEVPIPEEQEVLPPPLPSNEYLPPVTQKPELPLLPAGLPALPEAPVIPEPIPEIHETYLPPTQELESTPAPVMEIEMPHMPSEAQVLPEVAELPELNEVPEVPIVEEVKPGGYHYTPPAVPFDLPKMIVHAPKPAVFVKEIKPKMLYKAPSVDKVHVESHFIDIPRVVKTVKTVKHYRVPTKDIPIPVSVPHGLVSHSEFTQNHASIASMSSLQVNKFVVPSHVEIQPTITHDTVRVEQLKPIGQGFALQSIHSGNSMKTSMGSFNHKISVVSHEFPHLSSFGAQW